MFDYNLFIQQFPEFADASYPETLVNMYAGVAGNFIAQDGAPCGMLSGDSLTYATNLMTAHVIAMGKAASDSMAGGQAEQGGFVTSAGMGGISVSRLAPPTTGAWSYWLAQTTYGQSLWALLSVLSVGGIAVGGNCESPESASFRRAGGVFL